MPSLTTAAAVSELQVDDWKQFEQKIARDLLVACERRQQPAAVPTGALVPPRALLHVEQEPDTTFPTPCSSHRAGFDEAPPLSPTATAGQLSRVCDGGSLSKHDLLC